MVGLVDSWHRALSAAAAALVAAAWSLPSVDVSERAHRLNHERAMMERLLTGLL